MDVCSICIYVGFEFSIIHHRVYFWLVLLFEGPNFYPSCGISQPSLIHHSTSFSYFFLIFAGMEYSVMGFFSLLSTLPSAHFHNAVHAFCCWSNSAQKSDSMKEYASAATKTETGSVRNCTLTLRCSLYQRLWLHISQEEVKSKGVLWYHLSLNHDSLSTFQVEADWLRSMHSFCCLQ